MNNLKERECVYCQMSGTFSVQFFFMIVLWGGRAAHLTTTQDRQVVSLRTFRPNLLVQRVTAGLCSGVAVSLHGPCM